MLNEKLMKLQEIKDTCSAKSYHQLELLARREGFVGIDDSHLGVNVEPPLATPGLDAVLNISVAA